MTAGVFRLVCVGRIDAGALFLLHGAHFEAGAQVAAELLLADKARLVHAEDGPRLAAELDALDRRETCQ